MKFPTLIINYDNDLELIDKLLSIYSIGTNTPLQGFARKVLKYYIKYGYGDEAKKYIKEDEQKKDGDVRSADVFLRKNGYLKHGILNQRKSSLSDEMEELRQSFILKGNKIYQLGFKNV